MAHIIEGIVKTLSSNGEFTIHGTEGYSLEKDGKSYNVFWEKPGDDSGKESGTENLEALNLVACPQKDCKLQIPTDGRQWEFQLLSIAKANSQKVRLDVELKQGEPREIPQSITIVKVTLL